MEDDHSNHTVYIYPDEYEMNGKQLLKTNLNELKLIHQY